MGGILNEATGANRRAARAAGKGARAQERAAQAGLASAQDFQRQITSPKELQRIEGQIQTQERNLARQESLIDAIDPALKEAAGQALQLLQGQEAASVAPLRKQRQAQRQKLLNSLREQLGPGAETSSAGIQALTQFDSETSNVLGGAQQSSLRDLLGGSRQTRAGVDIGGEVGRLANISGQEFERRRAGQQAVASAFAPTVQTAGSRFVGQQIRAQQQIGLGNTLAQAAGGAVGLLSGGPSALFGGGGGGAGGPDVETV